MWRPSLSCSKHCYHLCLFFLKNHFFMQYPSNQCCILLGEGFRMDKHWFKTRTWYAGSKSIAENHLHHSPPGGLFILHHFPYLMHFHAQSAFDVLCPPSCWLTSALSSIKHAMPYCFFKTTEILMSKYLFQRHFYL